MASGVCVENNSGAECSRFQRNVSKISLDINRINTPYPPHDFDKNCMNFASIEDSVLEPVNGTIKGSHHSLRNLRSRGVKRTTWNEILKKKRLSSKRNMQSQTEVLNSMYNEEKKMMCNICNKKFDVGLSCMPKCHLNDFLSVTEKLTSLCSCNNLLVSHDTSGDINISDINGLQKIDHFSVKSEFSGKNGIRLNGNHVANGKTRTMCTCQCLHVTASLQQEPRKCEGCNSIRRPENNNNTINSGSQEYPTTSSSPSHSSSVIGKDSADEQNEHPIFGKRKSECLSKNSEPKDDKALEKTEMTIRCKWVNCKELMEGSVLIEHIKEIHLKKQFMASSESFVCLWEGCKVFNKASSSQNWLERHMLQHSGDKPFRCIVDGCGMRFTSHGGLERHVNKHFNVIVPPAPKLPRTKDDTPNKISSRKRKLKRKRLKKKTIDFFDCRSVEKVKERLFLFEQKTNLDSLGLGKIITFHSTVIGRKKEQGMKERVLLHWTPEDILPDEWILKSLAEKMKTRQMPVASLSHESLLKLDPTLYSQHRHRKQTRK